MAFYDYGEPIEYIVNQYFQKKKFYEANSRWTGNISLTSGGHPDDSLPEIPCQIILDAKGRASKFIYGDTSALSAGGECDPVIWQEELIRDASGKVTEIITTYPDGESVATALVHNAGGKVTDYKYS